MQINKSTISDPNEPWGAKPNDSGAVKTILYDRTTGAGNPTPYPPYRVPA